MMCGQTFALLWVAVAAQEGRPSSSHVGNFLAKSASPSTRDDPAEVDVDLCDGLDPSVSGSSPDCQKQDTCDFDARLCDLASQCLVAPGLVSFEQACVYTDFENIHYTIDAAKVFPGGSEAVNGALVRNCNSREEEVDVSLNTQRSDSSEWHWDVGGKFSIKGDLKEEFGIPFFEETEVKIELGFEVDVSGGQAWTHTSSSGQETKTLVTVGAESVTNVSMICAQNELNVPYNATFQAVCRLGVKPVTDSTVALAEVISVRTCLAVLAVKDGFSLLESNAHVLRTGTFKSTQVSNCEVEIGQSLPLSCNSRMGVQVIPQAKASATEDTHHEP